MTAKRTHGPCTCAKAAIPSLEGHQSGCPSLYPAQQEPDALTRLVRLIHDHCQHGFPQEGFPEHEALSLIAEAREEQGKALAQAHNDGLEKAAMHVDGVYMAAPLGSEKKALAATLLVDLRALKDLKP